jgi:hypothetical protein
MLFQLPLNNEAIQWLCDNAFESEMVLNRVLKYPVKSEIITNWVKLNYDKDTLRNRRADLVGWMIDYDSNFEVSNQTLIDDFEYLNSLDIKAIENYQDELKATEMMEAEFKETMENRDHTSISKSYTNTWLFPEFKVTPPELKQTKRYHKVFYNHKIQDETHKTAYDFQKMRTYYYDNLSTFKENLMLWSTNYSRIDRREKSKLLKRYYSPENYYSFIKIAERNKLVGPLKWLLKNYKLIPKEITEKKESKNENVF